MNCVKESGPEAYYLQLDIRRYFHSIGRDMLRSQLERKLKEAALIDLLMGFAHNGQPVGVPIGNLLSQLFANIYLSPMDHWIKRDLKIRHYARYVDDLVLPGLSRRECEVARNRISRYLADRYGMELSRCVIEKQSRGINFCGYRMWVNKRLIRKHSLHRFRRRVRQSDLTAVVSLLGHAKRTSSLSHMTNYINEVNHELYQALPEDYRRSHNSPGPLRQPG
jgi:retron-type reverse transcriptase